MMGGALPVSLLVGSIYDWQKKRYSGKLNWHMVYTNTSM